MNKEKKNLFFLQPFSKAIIAKSLLYTRMLSRGKKNEREKKRGKNRDKLLLWLEKLASCGERKLKNVSCYFYVQKIEKIRIYFTRYP